MPAPIPAPIPAPASDTFARRGGASAADRAVLAFMTAAAAGLGPLVALAPRGLPVWAVAVTLTALIGLARQGRLAALRPAGTLGLAAVAFVALAAASVAWSPSPRGALTAVELAYVTLGALTGAAWFSRLEGGHAARLRRMFVGGFLVGLAIFVGETALDHPVHRWWNAVPPEEGVAHTNVPKRAAALFAALAWPAAFALAPAGGATGGAAMTRAALTVGAVLAAAGVAAGLADSRSAMAGLAAGAAVWIVAALGGARFVRLALAAGLIVGFAAAVPTALALDRWARLDDADWLFLSARHRVEIWGHAAARIVEAPVLGYGIDASRALPPSGEVSRFAEIRDSLLPLHPHNALLQVWLELGAIGAALAVAAGLGALAALGRLEGRAQACALALLATGFAMMNTAYGAWQAWWMCGLLAAGLMLAAAVRAGNGRP